MIIHKLKKFLDDLERLKLHLEVKRRINQDIDLDFLKFYVSDRVVSGIVVGCIMSAKYKYEMRNRYTALINWLKVNTDELDWL